MFERLMALWTAGRLTLPMLDAAVDKGWITAEQRDTIADATQGG